MRAMIKIDAATVPEPQAWHSHLYVQVVIAIALGVLVGHFVPATGEALKPLGDGFIKLVKMIIAPVIFLTIVTGFAHMNDMRSVGRVAAKALAYFLIFSTLALIVGLIVGNVVRPGAGMNVDVASLDSSKVSEFSEKAHGSTVSGFLLDVIPDSLMAPLANGNILQALFVGVIAGIAMALLGDRVLYLRQLLEEVAELVFKVTAILMRFAPIGAFGAMAFTIGKYGIAALVNLAGLVATFYITSLLFVLVVLGMVARFAGFSIFGLIRYLKAELWLVLGTSSSESALPSLMQKMERAGCSKPIVGLVIPTGYSFNLDGTNIYMTLASLFIAQACGINLSWEQQALLLGVAMLSSKGAAGVTGAGFITLAATLSIVPDLPVAGMALVLGVDRFMSECRSLTNFIGNAVATMVVSAWEGGLDRAKLAAAMTREPALATAPAVAQPED